MPFAVFHWQIFATNLSKSVNSICGFLHEQNLQNRNDGFLPICSKNLPMENGICIEYDFFGTLVQKTNERNITNDVF